MAGFMNDLYEDHAVDTRTGFRLSTPSGTQITPKAINSGDNVMSKMAQYKYQYPGFDDAAYTNAAKADLGMTNKTNNRSYPYNYNTGPMQYPGMMPGQYYPGTRRQTNRRNMPYDPYMYG